MFQKRFALIILAVAALLLSACSSAALSPTAVAAENPPNGYLPTIVNDGPTAEPTAEPTAVPAAAIPDTGQTTCYAGSGQTVACVGSGQDGAYSGVRPSYTDNGDGAVTDNVTGLMWAQSPDLNGDGRIGIDDKLDYEDAQAAAADFTLAGYDDWRLPTITELYSLIDFSNVNALGEMTPFIDTAAFDFGYGDTGAGERDIDAQFAASTLYTSTTMNGAPTMFGVNFADGRIKGYPTSKLFYVYFVRGDGGYDRNLFTDNGDGTISDSAAGLMWQQADSGGGMAWDAALAACESAATGGYDDWRLPNAKELQSLVDYTRSPDATGSAAIDPVFSATQITNEAGQPDYAAYWTSTTHVNVPLSYAAYVNFGRAMGYMNGEWMDVHGAGAQRSDPKTGDPDDWPTGNGPQGDAIRIYNYVRCVRDDVTEAVTTSAGDTAVAQPTTTQPNAAPAAPSSNTPQTGAPPTGGPDLAAAAAQLGVSEQTLREALGPPPPDLTAAAAALGVSETALIDALGLPPQPNQ